MKFHHIPISYSIYYIHIHITYIYIISDSVKTKMLQYTTKKQRFFTIHMLHSSLNNALVVGSGWGDHGPPSTSGRIHLLEARQRE